MSRTDPAAGAAAVQAWLADAAVGRPVLTLAVRHTLALLVSRAPGRSVEVRVPPYAAVQCIDGPRHTRGTPPNTVETDPQTWLALATARVTWAQAIADGRVQTSGARADLAGLLPLADSCG